MANQYLKLRRSSVPGKIPDTSSLDFGEIAINTHDGTAFMKVSSSAGEFIKTIGNISGSFSGSFYGEFTGSLFGTSSWAENFITSSVSTSSYAIFAVTSSHALTASSADDFLVRGTLTAQTIIAQVITASTEYITGSTIFGSELSNTHEFTGSVSITGSLSINGVDYEQTSASFDTRILANSSSIGDLSSSFLVMSGSTSVRLTDLEFFSSSLDATFATDAELNAATASLSASIGILSSSFLEASASFNTRILENTASIQLLSSSFLEASASFDTRVLANSSSIGNLSSSFLVMSGSTSVRLTDLEFFSSSLDATFATDAELNQATASLSASIGILSSSFLDASSSLSTRVTDLEFFSSSLDATFATDAELAAATASLSASIGILSSSFLEASASFDTRILANSSSIGDLSSSFLVMSGSTSVRLTDLEFFSSSLDATFATDSELNQATASLSASIAILSSSFLEASASFDTRILANSSSIGELSSSFLVMSGSTSVRLTDLEFFSSSLDATFATDSELNQATASLSASIGILSSSFLEASASFDTRILANSSSIGDLSSSFLVMSGSASTRITDLEFFSSSLDATFATDAELAAATASLSASIGILSSSFLEASASFDIRVLANSSSIGDLSSSFLAFSASYNTGSFTGSFSGSFDGIVSAVNGTPTHIAFFDTQNTLSSSAIYQVGDNSIAINETNVNLFNPEALYVFQTNTSSINVISGKGNLNNYLQLNIQNVNQGTNASSDVVATANNGDEVFNYINMGINSENFTGFLGGPNDGYLYSTGNNLWIGNYSDGHYTYFFNSSSIEPLIILTPEGNVLIKKDVQITGSLTVIQGITGSLFGTASWAENFITSSVSTASFALTASSADDFLVRGTLTAQTIVAQVITASTEYITGSTIFGSDLSNTHDFTGSVRITGSLSINNVDYTYTSASFDSRILANSSSIGDLSSSFLVMSGSASTRITDLEQFSSSLDATFATDAELAAATASLSASIGVLSSSFLEASASFDIRILANSSSIGALSSSFLVMSSSTSTRVTDLEFFSSSLDATFATDAELAAATASLSASIGILSSSFLEASSSFDTRILANSSSIGALSSSFLVMSGSASTRITDLEQFSSSLDATFATDSELAAATASLSASIGLLSSSFLEASSSFDTRILANSSSIGNLSSSFLVMSGSASTRITDLEFFSSSLDATFATDSELAAATASLSASIGILSSSFLEASSSFDTRILANSSSIGDLSSSFLVMSGSASTRITDLEFFSSSLDATFATDAELAAATASLSASIGVLSSSFLEASSSFDTRILANSSSIGTLSSSFLVMSGSASTRITDLEFFSSSLDATFATDSELAAATASLSASIGILSSSFLEASASFSTRVTNNTNDIASLSSSFVSFSGSYNSGSFSGSFYGVVTGSLFGTASWAQNFITSSVTSASLAQTASYVELAQTASYVLNAVSSSYAFTASSAISSSFSNTSISASYALNATNAQTASYVLNAISASYAYTASSAISSSYAYTASSAENANTAINALTASSADNFTVRGTLTAQTIVAQVITASTEYVTGSTIFGSDLSNTHDFTGSVRITGSLTVNNIPVVLSNQTGSMSVLSASFASTASYAELAQTASYVLNAVSSSYAYTASSAINASNAISASYAFTASSAISASHAITSISASLAQTASYVQLAQTASYVLNAISASYAYTASSATNAFSAVTASYIQLAQSASYVLNAISSSYAYTASSAISSSYAINADFLDGKDSTVFATTGSNTFIGKQIVSGALQLKPTSDPDLTGAILTDTFLFQSQSNTSLGYDLYIRQSGNIVKWKWMEGLLETGLLYGGVVTWSGSIIYVSEGAGIIVNHNAVTSSEISPIIDYITWNDITASVTNITSSQVTYLLIDENGSLVQQQSPFTPEEYHEKIPLGAVGHFDYTNVSAFGGHVQTEYSQIGQINEFIDAFGPLKINGYTLNPQTGTLSLGVGSGTAFAHGGFYAQSPDFPSTYNSNAVVTASIARVYRSGSGVYFDTNNNNFYTTIDPAQYDDGSGTLQAVPGGAYTVQRVFSFPLTNDLYIYYGQNTYNTLTEAIQSFLASPFEEGEATQDFTIFVGFLIVKGNTTDLSNTADNQVIQAGLFRNTAGNSAGAGGVATYLNDLADVNTSSETNGQALIYDSGLWINGNPLSASYASSSSVSLFSISSSYSFTASSATNAFSAVSASNASTASYVQLAQTASYVLNAISSSYAYTASSAISASRANSSISSSYAFTASSAISSSNAISASYSFNSVSASYALTASYAANVPDTASYALFALSASRAITAASSSYPLAVSGSTIYSYNTTVSGQTTQDSIVIGFEAGKGDEFANGSVLLGYQASSGSSFAEELVAVGYQAGVGIDGAFSVLLGSRAGYKSKMSPIFGGNIIAVGDGAGREIIGSGESIFIGTEAGSFTKNARYSTFIGDYAGNSAFSASFVNFIGPFAGRNATSASYGIFLGYSAGAALNALGVGSVGDFNIIIGNNITLPSQYRRGVNIGGLIFGSGSYSGSNAYFSGSANGSIGINQPNPEFNFDVSGSGRFTNGLVVTSSLVAPSITGSLFGTASWAQNFVTSSVSTASFATFAATASSADNFTVRGTLTAQTIVAQVITASTEYITGSTIFGSSLSNTHDFTGSVSITGSLSLNNVPIPTGTGTSGQVTYWTGANTQTGSNNLFWDATNSRLGLNTVTPTATVHISGSSNSNLLLARSPISSSIFSISGSGQVNVGIPYTFTTPPRSFNVYGESIFQSANGAPNAIYIGANTSTVDVGLLITPTQLKNNSNNGTYTIIGDNLNIGSRIILNARNSDTGSLILGANNINTVKVYGTGRVGIQSGGTFTDTGETLQVGGSAKITNGLTVSGSILLTGSLTANVNTANLSSPFSPGNYPLSLNDGIYTFNFGFYASSVGSNRLSIYRNSSQTYFDNSSGNFYFNAPIYSSTFTGSFIGPLTGTASWASNAVNSLNSTSASYAFTASSAISASYALTASYAANVPDTASYALFALSASRAITAASSSYPFAITGSTLYASAFNTSLFSTTGSIVIGTTASYNSPNAYDSIMIGSGAGRDLNGTFDAGSNSVLIGKNAGADGIYLRQSVLIGVNAGSGSRDEVVAIGYNAGVETDEGNTSVFIGWRSGFKSKFSYESVFVGPNAGYNASFTAGSTFLGAYAGYSASIASNSTFVGYQAGTQAMSASYGVFIGNTAGFAPNRSLTVGSNNIIIGNYISLNPGYSRGINIGGIIFGSGSYAPELNSYRVISGSINGSIGINQPNPEFNFDVSGSGRFTDNLIITGSVGINAFSTASLHIKGKSDTGSLVLYTEDLNGSGSFRIYNNGNGISNPGYYSSRYNEAFGYASFKSSSISTNRSYLNTAVGAFSLFVADNIRVAVGIGYAALAYATGSVTPITGSIAIGNFALAYQKGGTNNIAIGGGALQGSLATGNTGDRNIAIGVTALTANTSGQRNSAIGDSALGTNSVGSFNTANGNRALIFNTSGSYNSAIGIDALRSNTTGSYGTAIGGQALYDNTTGDRNIGIGWDSGRGITTGRANTIIGSVTGLAAGLSNTILIADGDGNIKMRFESGSTGLTAIATSTIVTGSITATQGFTGSLFGTASWARNAISSSYPIAVTGSNLYSTYPAANVPDPSLVSNSVYLGFNAGNSIGYSDNIMIGYGAGDGGYSLYNSNFLGYNAGAGSSDGHNSNFLGYEAGSSAFSAAHSNFLGYQAGFLAYSAGWSNFLGYQAGLGGENASWSNFLGSEAGCNATNASYSNFFGFGAGSGSLDANNSNFLGQYAGRFAASASYSTLIGYQVGYNVAGGALGIKSNNIIIGTNITLENGRQNSINLGGLIFGTGSYSTTTGNPFSGSANGKIGINQPNPQFNFDVSGSGRFTNSLIVTGSVTATQGFTGSLFGTASWAQNFVTSSVSTASFALTASHALTASSADNFTVRGTLTAQTIIAQTITSSTDFVTGSTRFGTLLSNTHQFTGSVSITGSLSLNNVPIPTGTGTSGQVTYWTSANTQTGSNNLFWDATNSRLGIGTNIPPFQLTLQNGGSATNNGLYLYNTTSNSASGGRFLFNTYNGFGINALLIQEWNSSNVFQRNYMALHSGTGNISVNSTSDNGLKFQVDGTGYFSGSVGIGSTLLIARTNLTVWKNITGDPTSFGVYSRGTIQSDVTTDASYYASVSETTAASFTLSALKHYRAVNAGFGAGSTVTNQYAFIAESTITGATNNFGFYGDIAAATGRWNLYMNGTANNYMAGSLGIGSTSLSIYNLRVGKSITGGVSAYGIVSDGVIQSDVTSNAHYFQAFSNTQAASFTVTNLYLYRAGQQTIGAGSSVFRQYGFNVDDLTAGTNANYGFYGNISSGTGKWNLYMNGTAPNFLNGSLGIGSTAFLDRITLKIAKNITGATTAYGIENGGTIQSDVTSAAYSIRSLINTQATTFTLANAYCFDASQGTLGAGSTVTNLYGFFANSNMIGATNNYGFYGDIAAASGRWNLYMAGTAANYLRGNTAINTTSIVDTGLTINNSVNGSNVLLSLRNDAGLTDNEVSIKMIAGNSNSGELGTILTHKRIGTGGAAFIIKTNATLTGTPIEAVRVTQAQNLHIGSFTSDTGEKLQVTGNTKITGNTVISGSLTVLQGITGSLFGTASWAENFVTSSVSTASFALTASYAQTASFASDFTVANTLTLDATLTDYATVASSVVGSNNLFTRSTGSFTSAFFKYTMTSGSNSRSGEVIAVWNGATSEYTDFSTVDIGNTSPVTASATIVTSQIQFNLQTNTGGWRIKSLATFM